MGSSPQVRGPQTAEPCGYTRMGLIPAGAGTTNCRALRLYPYGAHPRRCGDHLTVPPGKSNAYGSSPQVRGPHNTAFRAYTRRGLIPAGAGTTGNEFSGDVSVGAHPRRCGDHDIATNTFTAPGGSSPQVRGPLATALLASCQARLIPAGAGTTSRPCPIAALSRAHPRRCGDH